MLRFLLVIVLLNSCSSQEQAYRLVHANDADSFLVTDYDCKQDCKTIELRMLGIDAPEYSQDPWGKRAMTYFLEQVQPDTKIYIEDGLERFDKYGRRLAFLFYQCADKRRCFYNEELLAEGYAVLFTFDRRQKYLDQFKAAQASAKSQGLNIWNQENGLEMSPSQYRRYTKSLRAKQSKARTPMS